MIVFGKPIAQPRPRFTARGGFARAYVPRDHEVHRYKADIIAAARKENIVRMEGPVRLECVFCFAQTRKSKETQYKISKPDLDNLLKAVMDALTEAQVWIDDAQVAFSSSAKVVGKNDATSIIIRPMEFKADAVEAT